jgi:hypothetical protein
MQKKNTNTYKRAEKKLKDLKGFYNHLGIYLIVNLIIIGSHFTRLYSRVDSIAAVDFERWLTLNTFSVAFFWGIGVAFHALKVFDFKIFKSWEDRKMKEFMDEESQNINDDLKF